MANPKLHFIIAIMRRCVKWYKADSLLTHAYILVFASQIIKCLAIGRFTVLLKILAAFAEKAGMPPCLIVNGWRKTLYPLMYLENRISFRRELYRICGQYATMIDSERTHRRIAA